MTIERQASVLGCVSRDNGKVCSVSLLMVGWAVDLHVYVTIGPFELIGDWVNWAKVT